MKKVFLILMTILGVMFLGCDNESDNKTGEIVIQAFDAPFQGDVEHINLHIIEVSVHKGVAESDSDTSAQWIVLSDVDTTIDFLRLVNGEMETLIQSSLDVGQYSQLRLLLGDNSAIVINGVSYELRVPSGSQSGVKLNLGFFIASDEITEIYLDFDAERSIKKYLNQDSYSLQPTFRVFKSVLSGTISGTIVDINGNGIQDISVYAIVNGDSATTLSNEDGNYKLILLAETYTISAAGFEVIADTVYHDILLNAEENLTDIDFLMQ
ncbi:MAG: DUF4382 domain-containing protein [Candidatus Marinimicrobia bacterium]|nr:DUF4382 domain-containing protein [Candidatus Neomarinimicrobiota bacterium]